MDIISGLMSAGTGGLLGLAGTVVQGIVSYKDKINQRQHEIKMRELDREELRAETEAKLAEIKAETQAKVDVATINAQVSELQEASKSFQSAILSEGGTTNLGWVGKLKAATRPILTGYLVVLVTAIYFTTNDPALKNEIVSAVIFCATTAVSFWFGSRGMTKAFKGGL